MPYLYMRLYNLFVILFLFTSHVFGQSFAQGIIYDQNDNSITNVLVTVSGTENTSFSDDNGKFILKYYNEETPVIFSHPDYDTLKITLKPYENRIIYMQSIVRTNDYHLGFMAGFIDFGNKNKNKNLENMPYFLGESDVNRQLQMLPGIEQGTEGYSNLFVRGGDVDQNLILYNGTPIYNPNHLFGISSTFHHKSIKNTKVHKGLSSARFGGRVSSYIELESEKTSNYSGLDGEFEMTPLNAGIYISSINKGKGFFTLAARRSWLDLLTPPESRQNSINANIYDIQMNFGKVLENQDEIEFNFMNTRDFYFISLQDDSVQNPSNTRISGFTLRWSNFLSSVKYKQKLSLVLSAEHQLYYSGYQAKSKLKEELFDVNIRTIPTTERELLRGIRDIGMNSDWTYHRDNKNTIHFGLQSSSRFFQPGKMTYTSVGYPSIDDIETVYGNEKYVGSSEIAIYAEDRLRVNADLIFDLGFRQVHYAFDGFSKFAFEPRIHGTYYLDNQDVFKFGYNRHNQFIGQLNIGTTGSPDNIWVPATELAKPRKVDILELSYERKIGNQYAASFNLYSKTLRNLVEVSNLSDAGDPELDWQSSVVFGSGRSYGGEFFIQKSRGDITGWLSYAYSRSFRDFEDLDDDEYEYSFDRPHMFKAYLNFTNPISDWNFGINYIIGSGQLFTLPIGKFRDINGNTQLEYNALNNYRSNTYQRLDISVIRLNNSYGLEQEWRFYLYNALGNKNPLNVAAVFDNTNFSQVQIDRAYLAYVPGVAYIVKF
ncbi:MAG: hypothetical protein EBR72_00760 [Bacteroidetes bacterium]|nr:hypothetical protein [Bacteroidota bacterium]